MIIVLWLILMITLKNFLKIVSPTKMISPEQAKNITDLYGKFLASESKGWSRIDDFLELLEFLDDSEIYRETEVLYSVHKTKKMGCPYIHSEGTICFVHGILEAVEAIVGLYEETENLHPKNRYILAYYLALSSDGQICILEDSSAV